MLLKGEFNIKSSAEDLWDFMLLPENLVDCVPGCEEIQMIDEKTYSGIVAAKVSFISVRFKGQAKLENINRPKHLTISGRGEDITRLGSCKGSVIIDLNENSEGNVTVFYKANVNVVGKLATMGDRIMRAKAKEAEKEFTQALSDKISGREVIKPELKTKISDLITVIFGSLIEKLRNIWKSVFKIVLGEGPHDQ